MALSESPYGLQAHCAESIENWSIDRPGAIRRPWPYPLNLEQVPDGLANYREIQAELECYHEACVETVAPPVRSVKSSGRSWLMKAAKGCRRQRTT